MTQNYTPKISPRNKFYVNKVKELAKIYSIIGVVDVTGLPAPQFQRIRGNLSKTAKVLIVKRNLLELVFKELEKTHKGISELTSKLSGSTGLVFTNDNPFTLYKFVNKNKSSAPAKGGQIAPNDIIVPAAPTSFLPGPIIGELGAFGIKTKVNAGKLEIIEDARVAKEGDEISAALAAILSRLDIEPMEVGLNIKAMYEEGLVYGRDTLEVDEDEILNNLKVLASDAFKLTIGLDYYTQENISYFLGEASRDSLGLGVGIAYPAAETLKQLVSKANSHMAGVASSLPENLRPAGLSAQTAQAPVVEEQSSANEESKKEEKETAPEVDAAAGLGGLF